MSEILKYPLTWPDGRARTPFNQRTHSRFKTSFAAARGNLLREIKLLGGTDPIFSSNIPRKADGQPYANQKPTNGDPGIACYFKRKGKQMCFACDNYLTVDDNMHAISLTIGALRGIARWGTGDMMERAFTGFTALPASTGGVTWWTVLGTAHNATEEQVSDAFRSLAKTHHPDAGGDAEAFLKIRQAYDQAQALFRR
jgi:hypothetical protein